MMSSRALSDSAFAISTSCCCAIDSAAIGVSGETSRPSWSRYGRTVSRIVGRSIKPQRAPARRFASEQDVAGDVEVVEQVQLLVDERDAAAPSRRVDVAHRRRRAVDQHVAGVGLLDAADDLHQRGLAGAVLAEQRDDFARVHLEAHAAERVHAGKPLVDRSKLEDGAPSAGVAQRPRSCASDVLNSSTLFWRITLVGMNSWWLGRNAGAIALERLRQQRDRLVAELVRLLHDGADDRARLDARQRLVVFVERDDLHLPDLARIADGVENRRAVVAPQPDERGDVGMADEHLGHVRLGPDLIGVVGAHVDDLDRASRRSPP